MVAVARTQHSQVKLPVPMFVPAAAPVASKPVVLRRWVDPSKLALVVMLEPGMAPTVASKFITSAAGTAAPKLALSIVIPDIRSTRFR